MGARSAGHSGSAARDTMAKYAKMDFSGLFFSDLLEITSFPEASVILSRYIFKETLKTQLAVLGILLLIFLSVFKLLRKLLLKLLMAQSYLQNSLQLHMTLISVIKI